MSKHGWMWRLATGFICGCCLQTITVATEISPKSPPALETPAEVVAAFIRLREQEMRAYAREQGIAMPATYERLLAAMHARDWEAVQAEHRHIQRRIGQYAKSKSDPALDNMLWQYVLEIYGVYEQFALWDAELLHQYAHDMMACIPEQAIYFGGTDPGRFVLTAYQEVLKRPFYVITQNALADNTYMAYVRNRYGDTFWVPSQEDSNNAFQEYVRRVHAGDVPPGAEVTVRDGRVSVQGVAGVMQINGILAALIVEENRETHPFVLEESYVIRWMFPYLTPNGLIFSLNREPTELTPAMVAANQTFWAEYMTRLQAHPAFASDEAAQKTFSKLRSGIAGLYVQRELFADAEQAFKEALLLAPTNPEATFRLADLYVRTERRDQALRTVEAFLALDPENEHAQRFLQQMQATP